MLRIGLFLPGLPNDEDSQCLQALEKVVPVDLCWDEWTNCYSCSRHIFRVFLRPTRLSGMAISCEAMYLMLLLLKIVSSARNLLRGQ